MLCFVLCCAVWTGWPSIAHGAEVLAHIQVEASGRPKQSKEASSQVVVWLTALGAIDSPPRTEPQGHYRLVQHHKEFTPHLLVIPVGSSVEFPNLDPFYHNVFSLFNGKRFDLGLYESGSTRSVRFDQEGVSYIFCNIHPEMGAVIIALRTPYFAVASSDGTVRIRDVPPGSYQLSIWAEGGSQDQLKSLSRRVEISSRDFDLGLLHVPVEGHIPAHKNKFGEDYAPPDVAPY
jgi:plastocyanin